VEERGQGPDFKGAVQGRQRQPTLCDEERNAQGQKMKTSSQEACKLETEIAYLTKEATALGHQKPGCRDVRANFPTEEGDDDATELRWSSTRDVSKSES